VPRTCIALTPHLGSETKRRGEGHRNICGSRRPPSSGSGTGEALTMADRWFFLSQYACRVPIRRPPIRARSRRARLERAAFPFWRAPGPTNDGPSTAQPRYRRSQTVGCRTVAQQGHPACPARDPLGERTPTTAAGYRALARLLIWTPNHWRSCADLRAACRLILTQHC